MANEVSRGVGQWYGFMKKVVRQFFNVEDPLTAVLAIDKTSSCRENYAVQVVSEGTIGIK